MRDILMGIPGYDPFRDQGDCWPDEPEGWNAIEFFPECIRHVEGAMADQSFKLEKWQQSIVGNLFVWKRRDSLGRVVRRYREVLIYVPRKSGKTPLAAAIALRVFFGDNEPGAQCYIAAAEREQAGLLFRQCKGMVEREAIFAEACEVYGGNAAAGQSKSLVKPDGSFLRVISADASTKHGGNTHLAIVDELHVQPNRDLVDVFRTSMSSANRAQPLLIYLTTADYHRESICNDVYGRACKVRDGILEDRAFLPVIYEASRDDDWTDPKVWAKANPNLGVSKSLDYMERECKLAMENPAQENVFKRLDLNIKTEQDCRVIPMEQWDACGEGAEPSQWRAQAIERLKGQACWGGIDLGSVSDLTAFVLLFGNEEDGFDILPYFWGPEENATKREKRDRVPYLGWASRGFLTLTDGNETDYPRVRRDINVLGERFSIRKIAADRLFQGAGMCQWLIQDGFDVISFGQGYVSMAMPTRRFLELLAAGKLRHGNNPVLKWMAGNAASEEENGANGPVLKFSKRKSPEKIDGIIAATMALGVAMQNPEEGDVSVYTREKRGFLVLG
jgi:phage terminase large subunit-like protein